MLIENLLGFLSGDSVAIYLFHGVIKEGVGGIRNYTNKHLEAKHFIEILEAFRSNGTPLTMDEVYYHIERKIRFPKNAYAITFDDGFENNYSVALPILREFNIPATVYATSGFVNDNAMSWIDSIEYAVESTSLKRIQTSWHKEAFNLVSPEEKIFFLKSVRNYVKFTHRCDSVNFSKELCDELGSSSSLSLDGPLDLKLTWSQVGEIHNSEIFSVGGHGHTHSILSYLSSDELDNEIDISIELFKSKAGFIPRHYSYPEGLEHCYSSEVIDKLKRTGIHCCPTAIGGVNNLNSDPFHLRRIMVP